MDTKGIVKEYENAMDNYHVKMAAYKKAIKKYNKEKVKYEKSRIPLIFVKACCWDERDGGGEIDFHVTGGGLDKLFKFIEKNEVKEKLPREPEEPSEPILEVRFKCPESSVPF